MTRRLNYWLLAFLLIASVPYYWYMIDDPAAADVQAKPISITGLRKLADSLPGPRPVRVRSEFLGQCRIMRNRLVAGWGLRPIPVTIQAYELTVRGAKPIVINAGVSAATVHEYGISLFDPAAQNRVNKARAHAAHTVILSSDPLQSGNLHTAIPMPRGSEPYALAPGVVVIPAPGISPDAKLLYARLRNGREFLFAGAAAAAPESLNTLHPPARVAEAGGDSGTETKAWLMTINALRRAAPDMTVVTAHDPVDIPHVWKRFSDHS
ncbi:hypothetical protein [Novosphingobium beihaiensis]|uniref:Uncharacterized protein n=1 Tax=Novosphingobium beihaiensis TaxID=2930389 RepID=A0ABT0BM76_9SPHN|nr:hypothetical protein [Novosphingobium beihaiensis]MCJ2186060.1 hypothetical protein [Novosphingobium beihaiensis]